MRNKGKLAVTPRGFGFVNLEDGREIFIPANACGLLIPNDEISFNVVPGRNDGQWTAEDIKLESRESSLWLGTARFERGDWILVPDELCFAKLAIREVHHIPEGMVVAVRVPAVESNAQMKRYNPCKLERILGIRQGMTFEVDYALCRQDFPMHFDHKTLNEVSKFESEVVIDSSAVNLVDVPFITVDGETTKDFDDAVFCEQTETGWHVMVAIADVSYYVQQGTALDSAAFERSTSVYLPTRVVPMLPDTLSNGLCSLIPMVDRRAVVADMWLDDKGNIIEGKSSVYRAFIRSHARVTYNEMTTLIEHSTHAQAWSDVVIQNMEKQFALYHVLEEHQKYQVMEFEDAEPKLITNEDGELDVEWHHRTISHKVVEQCMLLANRYVASQVQLYRHQPMPEQENWDKLRTWAAKEGVEIAATPSLEELTNLLNAFPEGNAKRKIAELKIRMTMQKAVYSPVHSSHFSLGFEAYTHFTSPIRRYADLEVHRLVLNKNKTRNQALEVLKTTQRANQCTERSNAARLVEREVWDKIKKRIMFRKFNDQILSGMLVSALSRGWLISINTWQTVVLVKNDVLNELGYTFSQEEQVWKDENGVTIELGQAFNVRIRSLVEDKQRVDLHGVLDFNA